MFVTYPDVLQPGRGGLREVLPWHVLSNFARNSLEYVSEFEIGSLIFRGFRAIGEWGPGGITCDFGVGCGCGLGGSVGAEEGGVGGMSGVGCGCGWGVAGGSVWGVAVSVAVGVVGGESGARRKGVWCGRRERVVAAGGGVGCRWDRSPKFSQVGRSSRVYRRQDKDFPCIT